MQNALDFSKQKQSIEIKAFTGRAGVQIEIKDYGSGIPDYAEQRIFDRFYSLSRPESHKKGTGLGLSFVKEIVRLHQGSIQIKNHPEGGVLATLILP